MSDADAIQQVLRSAIELQQAGDLQAAEALYGQILREHPNHPDALHLLGVICWQTGRCQPALDLLQRAIQIQPAPLYLLNLGIVQEGQGHLIEATAAYRAALDRNLAHPSAYLGLARVLLEQNLLSEASAILEELLQIDPEHLSARFAQDLMLPILYSTPEEIERFRSQFSDNLDRLIADLNLGNPDTNKRALEAIRTFANFYLAYQGKNDLLLQLKFGGLIHQIMAVNFPQWSHPLTYRSDPSDQDKIRVGYVSTYLCNHTVGKLTLGWLRYADRESFQIFTYHVGRLWDPLSEEFRHYSDHFYWFPHQLEAACQQIYDDRLDILVFLDIGMHPFPGMMASLQLAPVQCTTWTHPVTTGIPTIDYFLSSDLMEPEEGESHYSETLIRLPHLSIAYREPALPTSQCSRLDLDLPEDRCLYLCCQSLYKYLPQYDFVLAEIARRVPEALFVFLCYRKNGGQAVDDLLRSRLKRAFAQVGLESQIYCQVLPRLSWENYLHLNLLSDIFLDSLGWSGGNTTLEAVACGLPIVTCPGEFMRGRHAYAILKQLDLPELIAQDEQSYIDIAVTLGQNQDYRQQISEQIRTRRHHVFEDVTPVKALESFYRNCMGKLDS